MAKDQFAHGEIILEQIKLEKQQRKFNKLVTYATVIIAITSLTMIILKIVELSLS